MCLRADPLPESLDSTELSSHDFPEAQAGDVLQPGYSEYPMGESPNHARVGAVNRRRALGPGPAIGAGSDRASTLAHAMKSRLQSVRSRWALEILIVALLYYGGASLGLRLAFEKTNASPVWPSSGIALAAVLLLGYWVWPGIMLGAFLANVVGFLAHHAAK